MIASAVSDKFTASLIYDTPMLRAGRYVIVISPVWNEHASESADHKDVYIEVLCPVRVNLCQIY